MTESESFRPLDGYISVRTQLQLLIEEWRTRARLQFMNAQKYPRESMERRSLEMSAMSYFNCAEELDEARKL